MSRRFAPSRIRFLTRFALGMVAISAASGFLLALAASPRHWAVAVACGALFSMVLSSLGEWLIHGFLYHRTVPGLEVIRRIHHHGHHFALFPPQRYAKTDGYEFMNVRPPLVPFRMADNNWDNLYTKYGQVALHFFSGIPLIVVPAWFGTRRVPFVLAAFVTLAIVSWLLAHIHGVIHTRRQRWIERRRWFRWLDRHHYIHHIDLSANINFMLPLCDFLFGTQKATLDEEETAMYPAYELAARGVGSRRPTVDRRA